MLRHQLKGARLRCSGKPVVTVQVRDVEKTPIKAKLVQSLCAVCRDLGVTVVAEGIETVPERDCIIELGCDLLQGYLLAKPGPAFPTFSWGG